MRNFLSKKDISRHSDSALGWLRRGLEVTGGQGFPHSFSPIYGWAAAYPETTGYLIETFFDYGKRKNDPELTQIGHSQAAWLCRQQLENGAFAGGTIDVEIKKPSAFNTGQILLGLAHATSESHSDFEKKQLLFVAEKAAVWLADLTELDGSWKNGLYQPDFCPIYHTRAVWGALEANVFLKNPHVESAMRRALEFYFKQVSADFCLKNAGFFPNKPAFTHTIAYTIRGFLESGILLNEEKYVQIARSVLDKIILIRAKKGRTAGAFSENWTGDFSFKCVTGNCQLSLIASRFFEVTNDEKYRLAAVDFLSEIIGNQQVTHSKDMNGAMPGSSPFWGQYMRFRYPNWAAKFFLDALLKLEQTGAIE
jgi:hypothetical protein